VDKQPPQLTNRRAVSETTNQQLNQLIQFNHPPALVKPVHILNGKDKIKDKTIRLTQTYKPAAIP